MILVSCCDNHANESRNDKEIFTVTHVLVQDMAHQSWNPWKTRDMYSALVFDINDQNLKRIFEHEFRFRSNLCDGGFLT